MKHTLSLYITFKVYRADGTLKSKKRFLAQSWVRGFFWLWYIKIANLTNRATPTNFLVNDANPTVSNGNTSLAMTANVIHGIQVGTSNQALNAEDNKLIARITDGGGVGQFQYGSMVFSPPVDPVVAGVITQKINRAFTNSSGGPITVEEVGLHQTTETLTERVLTDRTLKTQTVLNTEILTVEYDFTETV